MWGSTPLLSDILNSLAKGLQITCATCFKILGVMESGPDGLDIFLKNVSWSRFQMAKAGPDGVSKWGCSPDILFGNVSLNF